MSPDIDLSFAGTGLVTLGGDVLVYPESGTWIDVWDGSAWQQVKTLEDETSLSVDVTPWAAGNPGFRVRLANFSYGDLGAFFSADNIRVTLTTGASCTTAP